MAGIVAWVKQIVLVALLVGVAEMLLPQAGLRKYAHTALGLIVLLAVLVPFLGFLRQGVDWRVAFADIPAAGLSGAAPTEPLPEDTRRIEAASMRLTMDVYRSRVEQAMAAAAAAVEGVLEAEARVEVDTEPTSPRFGTLLAAEVTVVPGERAEAGEVRPMKPVVIGGERDSPAVPAPSGEPRLTVEAGGRLREEVAAAIAREFGLQRRQIQVIVKRQ